MSQHIALFNAKKEKKEMCVIATIVVIVIVSACIAINKAGHFMKD